MAAARGVGWSLLLPMALLIAYQQAGLVAGQDLLGQLHAAELSFYRNVGWTVPPGHPLAAPQHLLEKYDPMYNQYRSTTPPAPRQPAYNQAGYQQFQSQPQQAGQYRQQLQPYYAQQQAVVQPQQPVQWQQPQQLRPAPQQQWQLPSAQQQPQWQQQAQPLRQQSQQHLPLPLPYSTQQGVATYQPSQQASAQAVQQPPVTVYYNAQQPRQM